MIKYAQIAEDGTIVAISYLSGEVNSLNLIRVPDDFDITNKKWNYNNGSWSELEKEEQTNDENKQQITLEDIMLKLDSLTLNTSNSEKAYEIDKAYLLCMNPEMDVDSVLNNTNLTDKEKHEICSSYIQYGLLITSGYKYNNAKAKEQEAKMSEKLGSPATNFPGDWTMKKSLYYFTYWYAEKFWNKTIEGITI